LVYNSIHDPTEVAIQKMIDASQRMIKINSQGQLGGMNPAVKKHFDLQIKTLQNAPRDADKLERLLKVKEREKKEAMFMEDTQRLVIQKLKC
jgi:methyl coenzyme M reductase beta subunit